MSSTKHSIIVVDDEVELVSIFRTILEKDGYEVKGFSDPFLALEYFRKTSDDNTLLITGLRMPGMNGIDLAKSVRELDNDIKIFLMTAFDIRDIEQCPSYLETRIDKLLQKPVRFVELKSMINDTLGPTRQ